MSLYLDGLDAVSASGSRHDAAHLDPRYVGTHLVVGDASQRNTALLAAG